MNPLTDPPLEDGRPPLDGPDEVVPAGVDPAVHNGALAWVKSSHGRVTDNAVELASLPDGTTLLRRSTDPAWTAKRFTPRAFGAFIAGVRAGEFDQFG